MLHRLLQRICPYLKLPHDTHHKMRIIVARYNESMDWTSGIVNCIIYNKGPAVTCTHPVIDLPNVGREGHTYLHHIIENYDQLDDYTMFLQGFPFDHTPFLENIITSEEWRHPFHIISRDVRYANITGDPTCDNIQPVDLAYHFNRMFNRKKTDHPYYFGGGAQFCVSRETIRSRPKEFYERLREMLGYDVCPIEGYVLERFWPMVFLGESLEERAL